MISPTVLILSTGAAPNTLNLLTPRKRSRGGLAAKAVRNGQVQSLKLNANLMKLAHYNDFGPAKNNPSSFNFLRLDTAALQAPVE